MLVKRKCIVNNEIFPRNKLIRFVHFQDQFSIDLTFKAPGRGAYVKFDEASLDTLFKKRTLNRAFKTNIPIKIYDQLHEQINKINNK